MEEHLSDSNKKRRIEVAAASPFGHSVAPLYDPPLMRFRRSTTETGAGAAAWVLCARVHPQQDLEHQPRRAGEPQERAGEPAGVGDGPQAPRPHQDCVARGTPLWLALWPPLWLPLWPPLWLTLPIHATASRCRAWRSALWGPLWTCLRGGGCARGRTRCSSCTACGAILARYLWLPPYGSPLGSSIAG